MASLSCIIIDDEKRNVVFLKNLLNEHCPNINVLATETSSKNGLLLIRDLMPQLVFLDVEMPHLNGFELLKKIEKVNFEVIFVTAYSQYAIEAFEYNAIGYITKPINTEKLLAAVAIATQRIEEKSISRINSELLDASNSILSGQKIPLSTSAGLIFVKLCEINYCESSGNYTFFHMTDTKKTVVTRQLGEYEKLLPDSHFIRIHDKYIINLSCIREYLKGSGSGGSVILENGIELPVATRRKEEFLLRFDKWLKRKTNRN